VYYTYNKPQVQQANVNYIATMTTLKGKKEKGEGLTSGPAAAAK
jgi:hypothetical protein